jgi:serine/threonine protein kinase
LAPEILKKAPYNKSVDFWNFGCLLYELLVGQSPFHTPDEDFRALYVKIAQGVYKIPSFVSPAASDLIAKLLQIDPAKRLGKNGVQEIKAHPFFSNIDWESMLTCKTRGPLAVKYDPENMKLKALNLNFGGEVGDPKALNLPDFSYYEFSQNDGVEVAK